MNDLKPRFKRLIDDYERINKCGETMADPNFNVIDAEAWREAQDLQNADLELLKEVYNALP